MQGVAIGNLLLSLFMSFSLSYLWGMINCLQLIVYLPLYNVVFPANVSLFLGVLINVATFDMIPMIDELNDFLWSFEFSTAANPRRALGWEALGFETKNFTAN